MPWKLNRVKIIGLSIVPFSSNSLMSVSGAQFDHCRMVTTFATTPTKCVIVWRRETIKPNGSAMTKATIYWTKNEKKKKIMQFSFCRFTTCKTSKMVVETSECVLDNTVTMRKTLMSFAASLWVLRWLSVVSSRMLTLNNARFRNESRWRRWKKTRKTKSKHKNRSEKSERPDAMAIHANTITKTSKMMRVQCIDIAVGLKWVSNKVAACRRSHIQLCCSVKSFFDDFERNDKTETLLKKKRRKDKRFCVAFAVSLNLFSTSHSLPFIALLVQLHTHKWKATW